MKKLVICTTTLLFIFSLAGCNKVEPPRWKSTPTFSSEFLQQTSWAGEHRRNPKAEKEKVEFLFVNDKRGTCWDHDPVPGIHGFSFEYTIDNNRLLTIVTRQMLLNGDWILDHFDGKSMRLLKDVAGEPLYYQELVLRRTY